MKVYVGHIVPLMESEEGVQEWVTEASLKSFEEYLDLLGKYLRESLKELTSLSDLEKAEFAADFIVAFYKYPLIATPAPPRVSSYALPQEVFWIWLLTRNYRREEWVDVDKLLIDRRLRLDKLKGLLSKTLTEFFKEASAVESRLKERTLESFLKVPSDTRPSNNVSKLIPHLLATSAIAASLYLTKAIKEKRKFDEKLRLELTILRLACLLHDIGKPRAWLAELPGHADESARLIRQSILTEINAEIREAVAVLVAYHHARKDIGVKKVCGHDINLDDLLKALREGDKWSSQIDRLASICIENVSSVLKDSEFSERYLTESGVEVQQYWKKFPEEKIRFATESAAKYLYFSGWRDLLKTEEQARSGVRVIGFDVRRIQSYISREKLRALMAASYAVDLFVTYCLPRALVEKLVFPENIIYAGGGFLTAISSTEIPADLRDVVIRAREILGLSMDVASADAPLLHPWSKSVSKLVSRLSAKKAIAGENVALCELGIEYYCEVCGRKPATKRIEELRICDECLSLMSLGESAYFKSKIESFPDIGLKWKDVKDYLLEWLSGASLEEARRGKAYNIAIVKADGNLMGFFMFKSLSLTDTIERSIRIDYGLKRGLYKLYTYIGKLSEGSLEAKENVCRAYAGLTYAGGDDLMAIWPAWLAIPGSLIVSYWFWRTLGGTRQLSIGVVSGKIKYNIWALRESAEALLSWCKSTLREKMTGDTVKDEENLTPPIAFISYYYTDSQQVLPAHIDSLKGYTKIGPMSISWQPYCLCARNTIHGNVFSEIDFTEILGVLCAREEGEVLENYLSRLLTEFYEQFTEGTKAKYVRDIAREIYEITTSYQLAEKNYPLFASTYLFNRWSEEENSTRREIYKRLLASMNKISFTKLAPLYDVFMLAKFAAGGRR
ncbi:MAG: hypothetical protein DRJ52_05060 [Thermoprotei archaeon]|nr:MAG: hypothetical protein DRJ52_05060 [Thermoprotei archaeon]